MLQPSASYSFILRTETSNGPCTLGQVATAIGEIGGDSGALDIVRAAGGLMVRDLTVAARDEAHAESIVNRVRGLAVASVLNVSDRAFPAAMGSAPIVFALANPIPDVQPEELVDVARVVATGESTTRIKSTTRWRFRGPSGALKVHATDINESMKLAAAEAIAGWSGRRAD